MKPRIYKVCVGIVFLGMFITGPEIAFSAKLTGTMVANKAFNRQDGSSMQAKGKMTLINAKGKQKNREYFLYSKDYGKRIKALTRFTHPADIAGTSFLNWDHEGTDDQFLYLPALKRVRRIVSTQKDGRFVNSDITYEDMERREVNQDTHQLLKTISLKNLKTVYVLKSTPKKSSNSQYSYRKVWIAKDLDYLLVKGEFYSKKGKLVKTLEVLEKEKIDGIWTSTKIRFHDLKRKHKTVVVTEDIKYNKRISDAMFSKTALGSY